MLTAMLSELNCSAPIAAKRLLGSSLVRSIDGQILTVKIVETEAYDQSDVASHSYKGIKPRTEVMFGPPGYLYVYFTYGLHFCSNIVVGPNGYGAAVLIRAVEPLSGIKIMENIRLKSGAEISNGPAKLCQALRINRSLNRHNLALSPLQLRLNNPLSPNEIEITTRVGINKAIDTPWRFYIKNNSYVSKK